MSSPTDSIVSAPLLSAQALAARHAQQADFLRLPERASVFALRAMRLRQLAHGHAMGDFLQFLADVAEAQQQALLHFPAVPLPDADALLHAAQLGQPPLPAAHWPRSPLWHQTVRQLAHAVAPGNTLQHLQHAQGDWLEQQADALVHYHTRGLDMAAAPLIAAALQVYWTHMVLATHDLPVPDGLGAAFGRVDKATACPCCGSAPVASVVLAQAQRGGQRFLQCSLCSTQWHMVRVKCSHCQSTQALAYQALQAAHATAADETPLRAVVQAETCDVCHSYLKIIHPERDAHAEAVADDVASLTLDLLVSDAGYQRSGANLFLLQAAPEDHAAA